jgi:hypothetical protein
MKVTEFLEALQTNGEWFQIALLATFVIILLRGLLIGIAHAFNMQQLERNSKAEILQALATLLLIFFTITIVQGVESYIIDKVLGKNSYVNCGAEKIPVAVDDSDSNSGPTLNLMEVVRCRVIEKAYKLAELQENIYGNARWPFWELSMAISLMGITVFQGNWVDSWYNKVENMRLLNITITTLLIGMNAIIVFINYVEQNMLSVFLPFGLLLRSFYFTRGIGAFFISVALGLYMVFPLIFVLTDPGFVRVPPTSQLKPISLEASPCYPTFTGVVSAISNIQKGSSSDTTSGSVINETIDNIQKMYIFLLLHPFVVLSITLIFIRYMMFLFGGEPYDIMRYVARVI